jgi:hypothetical protein
MRAILPLHALERAQKDFSAARMRRGMNSHSIAFRNSLRMHLLTATNR